MTLSSESIKIVEGEVLLFDKPLGWTSFDLVSKVRNILSHHYRLKKLKVGHAGTLDPLATGLMVLCTGKATRQVETLQGQEKEYLATLKLGATTPSFDLETSEDKYYPTDHVTLSSIQSALEKFIGETEQVPPVFSAIKVDGKRAYEHARKGNELNLQPRKINIAAAEVAGFEHPFVTIRVICSKGTYIRALARDLGEALNTGAYLTALRRLRSGNFRVDNAWTLELFMQRYSKSA